MNQLAEVYTQNKNISAASEWPQPITKGKGNLVQEYMQEAVKIRIFDSAYAGRTQQQIDATLDRLGKIVSFRK